MASTTEMLVASGSLTGLDDVVGVGDVDCAFLKITKFGPLDWDRYVAFKASKGARLRLYKLTGGLWTTECSYIMVEDSEEVHGGSVGISSDRK